MKSASTATSAPAEVPQPVPARRVIPVAAATAAALAPYGYLIGPPETEVKGRIDYYGNDVQVRTPAKFVSNDDMMLNLVTFNRRAPIIRWMEYHNKHTQTFIPLAGRPFIMVLGIPTRKRPDGSIDLGRPDLPDLDTVRGFYFDGSAGICMHIGTWHEVPFPLLDATNFVAIVTNETNRNLEEHDEHFESEGGDLVKRQLVRRLQTQLEIDLSGVPESRVQRP
jgi:ureidoglycolate lyase